MISCLHIRKEAIIDSVHSLPLRHRFEEFRHAAQGRSPKTRALFDYWSSLCTGPLPPAREQLDPVRMKGYLPGILLGEIAVDPFRVLFRLVGTAVATFSGLDFTGRYLDELNYGKRDSVEWYDCYRYLHAHRIGVIGDNIMKANDAPVDAYEYAILPLQRDGDPYGAFIAIEIYDDVDYDLISANPQVTLVKRT